MDASMSLTDICGVLHGLLEPLKGQLSDRAGIAPHKGTLAHANDSYFAHMQPPNNDLRLSRQFGSQMNDPKKEGRVTSIR